MCGFAAMFDPGRLFVPTLLAAMAADLHHRGPDSGATRAAAGMALVARRLAILDPTPAADQPMSDAAGQYTLVFNGCIYNFRRLRAELEQRGVAFRTDSDTEVLLQGYITWGEGVLDRLEGMYAFVIVDRRRGVAFAARDVLGIKPLYMVRHGTLTAFASEMRPLRRLVGSEPDPDALGELLLLRFAAGTRSNLKGIDRVSGGVSVTVPLAGGAPVTRRFASVLDTFRPNETLDESTAVEICDSALRQSVSDHLASDVGYAVQLSGGLDSALLLACAGMSEGRRLQTFAVNLGNTPHDERSWRNMIVERLHPEHHELTFTGRDFADAMPRMVHHMEGPDGHGSSTLLMLLCDEVAKTTKVVLTGEGADELFGGYSRYSEWRQAASTYRRTRMVPAFVWPFMGRRRAARHHASYDPSIYVGLLHDYLCLVDVFPGLVFSAGARSEAADRFSEYRERMFAVDQTVYLESLLLRQDRAAMAASVEARVPFAHMPLAAVVNSVPVRLRAPGGKTKPILKRIAEKWFPGDFVHRPKMGMTLPLDAWLSDPAATGRYLDLLLEPGSRVGTWADRSALTALVEQYLGGASVLARPLTYLTSVELWLRSLEVPMAAPDDASVDAVAARAITA